MMITIYSILPLLQAQTEDHTLQFLPIILITVIAVLFLLAIILSFIISRQVRIVTRQSSHINEIMQQALINGENNVLYYNISEDWSYKLYGHLIPEEGFSTENWKKHVHPEDLPYALDCLHKLIKGEKNAMKFLIK
jgi:flagellar biosynthesis protein FliQ